MSVLYTALHTASWVLTERRRCYTRHVYVEQHANIRGRARKGTQYPDMDGRAPRRFVWLPYTVSGGGGRGGSYQTPGICPE